MLKRSDREYTERLFGFGPRLAAVVSSFSSMDEVLYFLSDKPDILELGKLAISYVIMDAERSSYLYKAINGDSSAIESCKSSWESRFLQIAVKESRRQDISKLFANVTIIDFNYDRVLPHYLYWALQRDLEIPKDLAAECVKTLTILHPYGCLGKLEWEEMERAVPFGANQGNLLPIASRIFTYTEGQNLERSRIQYVIGKAEAIIVIGFGFHGQNIKIVSVYSPFKDIKTFMTVYGLRHHLNHNTVKTEMRNALKCNEKPEAFDGVGTVMFRDWELSISLAVS